MSPLFIIMQASLLNPFSQCIINGFLVTAVSLSCLLHDFVDIRYFLMLPHWQCDRAEWF
jgi:hypothetical protein